MNNHSHFSQRRELKRRLHRWERGVERARGDAAAGRRRAVRLRELEGHQRIHRDQDPRTGKLFS